MKNSLFTVLWFVVSAAMMSCVMPMDPLGPPGMPPPPTVMMPETSTLREQAFLPQIESTLRRYGLEPIYRGRALMNLTLTIDEGPINTDTVIQMTESGRIVADGRGRDSGPLLLRGQQRAENSFFRALRQFEGQLPRVNDGRNPYYR